MSVLQRCGPQRMSHRFRQTSENVPAIPSHSRDARPCELLKTTIALKISNTSVSLPGVLLTRSDHALRYGRVRAARTNERTVTASVVHYQLSLAYRSYESTPKARAGTVTGTVCAQLSDQQWFRVWSSSLLRVLSVCLSVCWFCSVHVVMFALEPVQPRPLSRANRVSSVCERTPRRL
jgi:hypothetical protein